MRPEEYYIIDEVYGNYISFQEKIIPLIRSCRKHNLRILELGCGTGITTQAILSSRNDIQLEAIDSDDVVIEFAANNLSQCKNIKFINQDIAVFIKSSKDYTYDCVVSAFVLHNIERVKRNKIFQEIYRTLKPGSIFLNADKFVSDKIEKQIQSLNYRIATYVETLIQKGKFDLLKEWVSHYIDDMKPDKQLKFNETVKTLEQIGFKEIYYVFKSEKEMLGLLVAVK